MDWIPPTQKKKIKTCPWKVSTKIHQSSPDRQFSFLFLTSQNRYLHSINLKRFIYPPSPRMCGSVLDLLYTLPLLRFGTVGRFGEILVNSPILLLVRHNFGSSALHTSQNHMDFTPRDPVTGHGVAR